MRLNGLKSNGKKIYFYLCPPHYSYPLVAIAEGLKALGVEFYANADYWRSSPDDREFLFRCDGGVTPGDCDVVILDCEWPLAGLPLPEGLFRKGRKFTTVYVDIDDGVRTHAYLDEYRQFDIILKCHYNNLSVYPDNFRPWAFGLSNRMIAYTDGGVPYSNRKKEMLVNFRTANPLRKIAHDMFLPEIEFLLTLNYETDDLSKPPQEPEQHFHWVQTGGRHYPSYYSSIKRSAAGFCFSGLFDPHTKCIVQYDSWRFWECLAAGCIAFHLELDKYGLRLPVMPESFKHYIGVCLDDITAAVERIKDEPGLLDRVSSQSRAWVIEFYSPEATARRFLQLIG